MREVSYVVALFGVLFLALAVAAWWRILHKPDQEPPTEKNARRSDSAAMIVVIAFGLCAVAALVAIAGMFLR